MVNRGWHEGGENYRRRIDHKFNSGGEWGGTRVVTSNQSESLISDEGNNRIVRPRFSLNGESKCGRYGSCRTRLSLRYVTVSVSTYFFSSPLKPNLHGWYKIWA